MSNKKIIIVLSICIFLITLLISNKSYSFWTDFNYGLNAGDRLKVRELKNDYSGSSNDFDLLLDQEGDVENINRYLYCIYHEQGIEKVDGLGNYIVKHRIDINDTEVTIDNNIKYQSLHGLQMAAILARNEGYGKYNDYNITQLLLYQNINNFLTELVNYDSSLQGWTRTFNPLFWLSGPFPYLEANLNVLINNNYFWLSEDGRDDNSGETATSWYHVSKGNSGKGNPQENDLLTGSYTIRTIADYVGMYDNIRDGGSPYAGNAGTYPKLQTTKSDGYILGPYSVNFGGTSITSIKAYNGSNSYDVSCYTDAGGNSIIDKSSISSGSQFYIKVPRAVTHIDKVGVEFSGYTSYNATLYLLYQGDGTKSQNLLYGKGNAQTKNLSVDIPCDIEINGGLRIVKRSSVTGAPISGAIFKITGPSYPDGALVDMRETSSWSSNELRPGEYTIEEIQAPPGYNLALQTNKVKANVVQAGVESSSNVVTFDNTPYGNLQIQKVDAVTGSSTVPIVQKGVVFKIYYLEGNTKKYIGKNFVTGTSTTIATMDFTEDESQAKEFITEEDGKTEALINIPIKTYYAKEISLTEELLNYYNVKVEPDQIPLQMDDDGEIDEDDIIKIKNTQEYVDISGYVWIDKHNPNKETTRNDLYKDFGLRDEHGAPIDTLDEAFNGIKVTLKDPSGNVVQTTTTGEYGIYNEITGGEYIFRRIPIERLGIFHVEYTYDGLIYQSVGLNINKENGSKATDEKEREILDSNFKNITNNGSVGLHQQSVAISSDEEYRKYTATYDSTNVEDEDLTNNYVTLLGGGTSCYVNASTKETYNIGEHYVSGETLEIRYINLGVYEKPQADFALTQDLDSIKVGINGQWHVYKYETKDMKKDSSAWDIGVRFKDTNIGTYTRPIYQSDAKYTNKKDKSKELEVYLNYKIGVTNESTYIGEVNTIQNYYDKRYDVNAIGNRVNNEGNLEKGQEYRNIEYTEQKETSDGKYKTTTINANRTLVIGAGETKIIYLQYKMEREAINAALAGEEIEGIEIKTEKEAKTITVDRNKIDQKYLLYNIAEISSYTVYYNNRNAGNIANLKTVAAVDKDSIPGNITPGRVPTYEDDTEAAPPVVLVRAGEKLGKRTITGNVFEDIATTNEEGKESNGNGIYEPNKEKTINNVEVTLHEINQEQNGIQDQTYKIKQEDNGTYKFEEYIPGQYIITFKWGDNEYRVQNYKGTIYNEDRYNRNIGNQYWYKEDIDTRYTDAIDSYDERIKIDDQMARITDRTIYDTIDEAYKEGYTGEIITKMTSTTPTMEFGVEYITDQTDGQKQNIFEVKNVDFGIIERPAQRLELRKRVSSIRLILANQQELVNIKIDEEGNITGTQNYLTYMKPNAERKYKGNIRIEMDNELIQGSTIEIGYEFIYTNRSELDYMTKRYYLYGTRLTTDKVVTLKPSRIVDFLDKEVVYGKERNSTNWKELTTTELKELNPIDEHNKGEYLKDKTILCSSDVGELKPQEKAKISMNTSKYLGMQGIEFKNEADTVKIEKPTIEGTGTGIIIEQQIGKVVETFPASSTAESVTIVPSTGENRGYVIPIIVGMTALIIMGVGIVVIKKKVLKDK